MARKKPLSRAPKEPEEILSAAQQVLEYVKPYLKWLITGGVILVLVLAGWSGYSYWQYNREVRAQAALDAARPQLSRPDKAEEALKSLDALIQNYPSTRAAQMAKVFKGHLLYQTQKYIEAAKIYEELRSAAASLRDYGWNPLVTESLSYCYEAQGDYAKAAQTLKPVLDQAGGNFQTVLLARLAMLADKAGNQEEAKNAWQKLLSQAQNPALVSYWKERLAESQDTAKPGDASGEEVFRGG
jgi:predicted negative regulator of RcsB-dependent stress response